MFEMLVKFVLWLIGKISSIIILPIVALISTAIPNFSDFITYIEQYLSENVFPVMAWVKRVIINFGVPQTCFTFIIAWYTFRLSMMAGIRIYALIHNLYVKYKP